MLPQYQGKTNIGVGAQYAKGKGHSGYWGALGMPWILGLLVLLFLPDRHKGATRKSSV